MSQNLNTVPESVERFSDVPVQIEALLEDRLMSIEDVARIEVGSVIALNRAAGETLEAHVGNVRFALAEVVVIEDTLALRIAQFVGLEG